jgi:predicted DNA-binding protein (MmcQ/YjbR family)
MSPVVNTDWLREICLAFPGTIEQIQWGNDLLFKVAGKMFAATPLEPAPVFLSFKTSPENFADLTERPNIIPAPYLARAQWVALESKEALSSSELATLLRDSYDLVVAKLPKKIQESLGGGRGKPRRYIEPQRASSAPNGSTKTTGRAPIKTNKTKKLSRKKAGKRRTARPRK